jgi:hypothetical protein
MLGIRRCRLLLQACGSPAAWNRFEFLSSLYAQSAAALTGVWARPPVSQLAAGWPLRAVRADTVIQCLGLINANALLLSTWPWTTHFRQTLETRRADCPLASQALGWRC